MRIHPVTREVAYDDHDLAREVGWFGDFRLFQRCGFDPEIQKERCDRILARIGDRGTPIEPRYGSNEIRSGALAWHSFLSDGPIPRLSFSSVPWTKVGYAGAVAASADVSIIFDQTKTTIIVVEGDAFSQPIQLGGGAFGRPFVDQSGRYAIILLESAQVVIVHLESRALLPTPKTVSAGYWHTCFILDGELWICYQVDAGLVTHPAYDPTKRIFIDGPSDYYGLDLCVVGSELVVRWSTAASESRSTTHGAYIPLETLRRLPAIPLPTPPIQQPIGPLGPPLPEGTEVNVAAFFTHDDRCWPRGDRARGDTHGMDMQVVMHYGEPCIWFAKFDRDGKGRLGELKSVDADPDGYIHVRADCSNEGSIDTWTDTRWLKKRMQIGRRYGFDTGPITLHKRRRSDGLITHTIDFSKEMWVIAVWPRFWCGEDFGECRVLRYCYNNTGGREGDGWRGDPALHIETYYLAIATDGRVVSWGDWTADPSTAIFKTGTAVFPEPAVHSDFWLLGGQRYPPDLPTWHMPATIPKGTPAMTLPAPVLATVVRFVEAYPPPQANVDLMSIPGDPRVGAHEQRCRHWTKAVCEQVRSSHGPEWGWKRASAGRPESKETLARQSGNRLDGWDLLTGVGTGSPVFTGDPGYHDLIAEGPQIFIPVQPVDRLGRASVRPDPPSDWIGKSAFDLGARLKRNDRRWLDGYAKGFRDLRVMVSRQSGPTPRSLADGREQLTLIINTLRGTAFRLNVVLLCDTLGYSKDEMREHVRQCNTILLTAPEMISLVEGWNEAGHPTQSPDSMDIQFHEEIESLIDTRFPFAWGGEFEGGSCVTWHSDRGTSPEDNAVFMAQRQEESGKPWIDDEAIGGAEPHRVPGRQRIADPAWFGRQARAAKAHGLRTTLHTDAGLTCNQDEVGPTHEAIKTAFLAELSGTLPLETTVTAEKIAQVIAGTYFEEAAKRIGATGTVEQKRPQVHAWILAKIQVIDTLYEKIFKRSCDLEGYGSRILLYIAQGLSDTAMEKILQDGYDRGDR